MAGRSQFDSTLTFNIIRMVDQHVQPFSNDIRKRFRAKFDSLLLKSHGKRALSEYEGLSIESLQKIPAETNREKERDPKNNSLLFDIASLQRDIRLNSPINTERGHLITSETNQINIETEERVFISSKY